MSFRITTRDMGALAGLDRIAENLKGGSKTALEAGAKAGLVEAQNKVPVKTGNLQRSLYSEVTTNSVVIGGRADYTAYVEFGTSRGLPARPFLRPAQEVARRTIEEELAKIIRV